MDTKEAKTKNRILKFLARRYGVSNPVSHEELATRLNISPSVIAIYCTQMERDDYYVITHRSTCWLTEEGKSFILNQKGYSDSGAPQNKDVSASKPSRSLSSLVSQDANSRIVVAIVIAIIVAVSVVVLLQLN